APRSQASTGSGAAHEPRENNTTGGPLLQAALAIARRRPVFPCNIEKRPLVDGGFKAATTDPATIEKWWTDHPNALIGSPTGGNHFVLDIDLPHGPAALEALEAEHGPLPVTLEQKTGGGGRQLFFKMPPGADIRNSTSKIGPGLDIRANGGYSILPPSPHKSGGRYEWKNKEQMADAPAWLVEAVSKKPDKATGTATGTGLDPYAEKAFRDALGAVMTAPEGTRNAELNRQAHGLYGLALAGRLNEQEITRQLEVAGSAAGLSGNEIAATLASAQKAAQPREAKQTGNTGNTGDSLERQGVKASPVRKKQPGTPGTDARFTVSSSGVYHKSDEPDAAPLWISAPLHVRAMTRNEHGESWGRLLEFTDPDGRRHDWACPLELLAGDGLEFRKVLMAQGLRVAPGSKARQLLAHYVQIAPTDARCLCTDRPGWHGAAYVLPGQTIGEQPGERVLLQTTGEPPRLRQAGTVEGWRENLARYCVGNTRLVVAVSASFAAPLLNLTGDESGGLNLVGSSSTGKTTALRVAATVWGGPDYVNRWRATDNGLEAVAAVHNDGLLILDELAQIDPRRAGEVAYMLANGTGKHRARRDGMARTAATWRLLFLSAGEVGLADHMMEAGRRVKAGQEVRLADIPADAGAGFGLFEELHGFTSAGAFADHLAEQAGKHHGTAIIDHLARLTKIDPAQIKAAFDHLRADFISENVPADADGQARRVAARLALIAAGGELAQPTTGWPKGEAIKGAAACFAAWLNRRGGAGSQEEAAALSQVRHFIESHGESRFKDLDGHDGRTIHQRAGYRRTTESGTEFHVLPEVFKRELCAGMDHRAVARILRERGHLRTEAPDRLTMKTRNGRVYIIGGLTDES
ncbi:DUF927 domain-containing protein, partial [Desulfurivibrio sp. C05AmB]|uniref:DUF927 domain-containing protein n=1 Tax=Desulfurivibrio sp. C05AmB TaxID=3374371 RepID=UPI00376F21C9